MIAGPGVTNARGCSQKSCAAAGTARPAITAATIATDRLLLIVRSSLKPRIRHDPCTVARRRSTPRRRRLTWPPVMATHAQTAPRRTMMPLTPAISARLAALAFAALLATPALAHADPALAGGFVAGVTHPLAGPDHLLAMVAVGIWGAILGRPLLIVLPVLFPTIMAVGGALGMLGVPFPPVEIGIAMSVLALGGAIAVNWRAPIWLATAMVGLFGLFHGYAHGTELPSIADPITYSLGFVLVTGMLHILGIGIGMLRTRPGGDVATRIAGGAIAASGIWFLVQALA
jgi:urease accessory protein